ncbi:MAG: molybdenum cofactor biosynthesis protein B [Pirellulaceae bacterium]|nr:MAG: molybdenum cofactor biosynthesis protein B [Pirellulaceae bacterium]
MPSASTQQHRRAAPQRLGVCVLTISDSRTEADDKSGALIAQLLQGAGHCVIDKRIVKDDRDAIAAAVGQLTTMAGVDAIISTGGTGIAPRDCTPEAIRPLLDVEIPGFGEVFRMLSWHEVGAATMLSRAFAGRVGRVLLFCLPGSSNAVRLAMEQLIIPELPHLVYHSR